MYTDALDSIPSAIAQNDVIVFLHFDALQLSSSQRASLQNFIISGKGFVGIGLACPSVQGNWTWYEALLGVSCDGTAAIDRQKTPLTAEAVVDDRVHVASQHLPERWTVKDFFLDFTRSPRSSNHVLATLMEQSYVGGRTGWDHPVSWCKFFHSGARFCGSIHLVLHTHLFLFMLAGKSFYTSLGLSLDAWASPQFAKHVGLGIQWAAGQLQGDCNSTLDVYWEKQTVDAYAP
jgi:cytochrome c